MHFNAAHRAPQLLGERIMQRLTNEQAIVVSGYTGVTACPFSWLHEDVERRIGRPVFTHEFGSPEFMERVKKAYRDDFLAICATGDA
jgi:hypothetical protein